MKLSLRIQEFDSGFRDRRQATTLDISAGPESA
jgi:hypothetical protein